jgi:transposase
MVIIMDNCSTHIRDVVREVIESSGHLLRYLPPYSPNFNPIELTFGLLKAWIRCYFWLRKDEFATFSEFLIEAIEQSRCGCFARKQFRHCGRGYYIKMEELERIRGQLRVFERGNREEMVLEEV